MDKRLAIKLNGNRTVNGTLRGFDQFMNIVLDETEEEVSDAKTMRCRVLVEQTEGGKGDWEARLPRFR